jgi:Fe-Mn family superoxide dismutase
MSKQYQLPKLKYEYYELWPYITEEQLRIHHQRHHQAYVDNANKIMAELEQARKDDDDEQLSRLNKSLSFNVGGHVLHSLFWDNMQPADDEVKIPPKLKKQLEKTFESVEEFKQEFSQAANAVEGSGWGALVYDRETKELIISQIEKHNLNLFPNHDILLVVDVWEHAYYIDYRNERDKFIQSFWEIVNWEVVEKRWLEAQK